MIPQSFDRTYADQAGRFATRTPIPFDATVLDILRTNGVLAHIVRRPRMPRPGSGDEPIFTAKVRRQVKYPNLTLAAEELDAVVAQAERGRAWHPAMGVSWGTADQAAQR